MKINNEKTATCVDLNNSVRKNRANHDECGRQ